jgi:hypothetical protein
MDASLLDKVRSLTPEINGRVAEGLATEQILGAEQYIDQIFSCAAADFPEGLTYEGSKRCTPEVEFREATRARESRESYELARSDFYMVAYTLKYFGEELYTKYIYLPFVKKGGLVCVSGKQFAIHPVLADPAFSVNSKSMFIQLTRTRLTFERTNHHFMANDERETIYVVWSWVHMTARNRQRRRSATSKIIYSTMANYLFLKKGFTKTLAEYAGADVVVGNTEINEKNYPKKDWVICSTTGIKPRAWTHEHYASTSIRVAIPISQYNQNAKSLIGSFFYIVDHFPNRFSKAEYVDDPWVWKVILGHIIFESGTSEGLMVSEINDHITSLDEYIDFIVWEELNRAGVPCKNIDELFMYVIETLSAKTASTDVGISSIYDKRLITLRYVMFDIVKQINTLMYKLRAAQKKRNKLEITEINNLLSTHLRSSHISKISNHSAHPEVSPISTSTDNMFFGITSTMLTQDSASSGGGRGKKGRINLKDPSKHLHVSVAEIASYNNLPKSDPTGRSRINPCLKLEHDGMVTRDEDKKPLLDFTQTLLNQ